MIGQYQHTTTNQTSDTPYQHHKPNFDPCANPKPKARVFVVVQMCDIRGSVKAQQVRNVSPQSEQKQNCEKFTKDMRRSGEAHIPGDS